MRAYVFPSGTRIAPFGDPAAEALFHGHTLAEERRAVLASVGLEVVEAQPGAKVEGPGLVLSDDLYLSRGAAAAFLDLAPAAASTRVLAMPVAAAKALPLQHLARDPEQGLCLYDCWYLPGGAVLPDAIGHEALRAALSKDAAPLALSGRPLRLRIGSGASDAYASTTPAELQDAVVMQVRHWVHVHRLNLLGIGVSLVDRIRANRLRMLFHALRSFSFDRGRFRSRMRRRLVDIAPDCHIDPTARIETSVIGRGAKIGSDCVIKHSIIGEGCVVGDATQLSGTVLGPRCTILPKTWMLGCVAYPGAFLSNDKVQLSLFGKGTTITAFTRLLDLVLEGEIRVEDEGALHGLGTRYQGSCLGHGASLGIGVWVQPGRAIPNGLTVVAPPGTTLARIPGELDSDRPYYVSEGTLVPL